MIYSVRLCSVDLAQVPAFFAAFRRGGLWTDIARLQAGHIHTDLLRNPSDSSKFMSIEFWTSINALLAARRSPELRSFARWLSRQSIDCEGLGMFVFPPQPSAPASEPDESTCPSCLAGEKPNLESHEFEPDPRSWIR